MGAEGLPAVGPLALARLPEMPRWRPLATRPVGDDLLTEFENEDT
jgi:hypothetical protein